MGNPVGSLGRPSARGVERTLAALLVGLAGTYALGVIVGDVAPLLDTAGVVAVHLAVLVGSALPVAVLLHAAIGRVWTRSPGPSRLEVVTATVALAGLGAGLWLATAPGSTLDTPLFAVGTGGVLVLVGLVAGRTGDGRLPRPDSR